jgi:hypothetical protein
MADHDPRSPIQEDGRSPSSSADSKAGGETHRNATADARAAEGGPHAAAAPGAADGSPQAPGDEGDDRSGLDRAEAVVDNLAARVSSLLGVWGRHLLRFTSRARESVQDFWADVQDFRHGKKP